MATSNVRGRRSSPPGVTKANIVGRTASGAPIVEKKAGDRAKVGVVDSADEPKTWLPVGLGRRAAPFLRGKSGGRVPWHQTVRPLILEALGAKFYTLWPRLNRIVGQEGQDVVKAVVTIIRKHCGPACPDGYHLHVLDAHGRSRTVSSGTLKNFWSRTRRTLQ